MSTKNYIWHLNKGYSNKNLNISIISKNKWDINNNNINYTSVNKFKVVIRIKKNLYQSIISNLVK